ncbi:MAG: hypothetical protein ACXWR1_00375 [Bdellovibrionota bacterium]
MALPHRKRQNKKPSALPKEFLHTVSTLFEKQFKKNLAGSSFLAYADLYGDEVVLGISLSHPKSLPAASLHVSADLSKDVAENPSKVTDQLKVMVDVAASWFSQCFEGGNGLEAVLKEMSDADPAWQNFEWEGHPLYVKLNRSNYTLEKAAAEFLKKNGFEDDGDDPLDDLDEDIDELN